jgi:hypothetical protein
LAADDRRLGYLIVHLRRGREQACFCRKRSMS